MSRELSMSSVLLVEKVLRPWMEKNVIAPCEFKCIVSNLKHLAEKDELKPFIIPKLIDMEEAASMLGIGLSLFKKCEREGRFPFRRKMIGTSVKYRNTDIIDYINSNDNPDE